MSTKLSDPGETRDVVAELQLAASPSSVPDGEPCLLHALKQALAQAQLFYVTYGEGSTLQGCYSSFFAPDIEQARNAVFKVTGGKHAHLYAERDWVIEGVSQATRYKLRLVPLQPQKRITPHNRKYL